MQNSIRKERQHAGVAAKRLQILVIFMSGIGMFQHQWVAIWTHAMYVWKEPRVTLVPGIGAALPPVCLVQSEEVAGHRMVAD